MNVGALAEKYRELYGEPTRSRNKEYLKKRLAWRIQELAEGGLSQSALARIQQLGDQLPERWRMRLGQPEGAPQPLADAAPVVQALEPRDPRVPPVGTVLRRVFDGKTHEVTVCARGLRIRGASGTRRSRRCERITGTPWNGFLFFGSEARECERGERGMSDIPSTGRRWGTASTRRRCRPSCASWRASTTTSSGSSPIEQKPTRRRRREARGAAMTKRRPLREARRSGARSTPASRRRWGSSRSSTRSTPSARPASRTSSGSQGWTLVDERYDDGGFTGANIDRPAFQRLMADVEAGKVDVIVVYKVDRLSRSLLDFAKVMERFNAAGASFVSVTQNFSTADAMGRLTLNMLMSFAEFEREMIGERTRDKIAGARRKGKWTGGPVPFGYSVRDKKLLVNDAEAHVVREAFALFLAASADGRRRARAERARAPAARRRGTAARAGRSGARTASPACSGARSTRGS